MTIKILKRYLKNIVKRNNIVDESSAEHRKKWQQRYFISSTFTLFTDDERTSSRTLVLSTVPVVQGMRYSNSNNRTRGNRVKSQREKVSGKVVKSEKSKGDKGLIPRGEEVLPTELTSLLTDVTRFFEPPRTPLLLRLVKHTCQRLAYPLVPLLARPKPSPKTIYTCIYHTHTYTVYVRGRSKEVGVGIGFRFRRWPRNEERSGARGEGGGRRRRRRRARNRLSNLEPSLDLNEIVSYVTAEWLALRSYVRGKRAITRLSFGRRFLIPPALTLISR